LTDPDAIERFQALYTECHGRVYAYAVSRAGRQLADEVVSDVFLIAWRRLADVPSPALPWLLGVARNVATGQFRAAARHQAVASDLSAWVKEAEFAAPDVADQVSERISVLTALAALPEADRELLTLAAWHGLPAAEAAQVLGCSKAAYFVRLHRARRRLERAMADSRGHPVPPRTATGPAGAGPAAGFAGASPAARRAAGRPGPAAAALPTTSSQR
jgi:RNA polymerase sigma-70 factor, ECF subfamily